MYRFGSVAFFHERGPTIQGEEKRQGRRSSEREREKEPAQEVRTQLEVGEVMVGQERMGHWEI